jgi:hypothetical protein
MGTEQSGHLIGRLARQHNTHFVAVKYLWRMTGRGVDETAAKRDPNPLSPPDNIVIT